MPRSRDFVEFVLEQLALFGRAQARAMFGGFGIYRDNRIFAIIVNDRLYSEPTPRRAANSKSGDWSRLPTSCAASP